MLLKLETNLLLSVIHTWHVFSSIAESFNPLGISDDSSRLRYYHFVQSAYTFRKQVLRKVIIKGINCLRLPPYYYLNTIKINTKKIGFVV